MVIYIELYNPSKSYLAGQVVEGQLQIRNQKPIETKEISIRLEGIGKVVWNDIVHYNIHNGYMYNALNPFTRSAIVTFRAEETYVHQNIVLAGDGHNFIKISGDITFPFWFLLPRTAPSSFNSKTGLVSYSLIGQMKTPMFSSNEHTKLSFTVNGILDLNVEYGATLPQEIKRSKGSNCFACRKGNIGFVFRLPNRKGYVPGEMMDPTVEVTNSSNKKILGMKLVLAQRTTCYAMGKSKTKVREICQTNGPEVEEGDYEMWIPQGVIIPPLPPTRLGGICRLIDVQYFIMFVMRVSGLSDSLTAKLPVMIGTIPLRSTFDELRTIQQSQSVVMPMQYPPPQFGILQPQPGPSREQGHGYWGHTMPDPSIPILPEYPDLPPPTYAEAMASHRFQCECAEEQDNGDLNGFKHGCPQNKGVSSATLANDYVPNYISYNAKYN